MPTYEYRCTDCDHNFDIFQSFTDDSLTVCPECGGRLKKVFGNIGIAFKGSGFYVTDSGSGSRTASGSSSASEGSSGSDSASSDGSGSDSATATGSDSGTASGSDGSSSDAAPAKAASDTQ